MQYDESGHYFRVVVEPGRVGRSHEFSYSALFFYRSSLLTMTDLKYLPGHWQSGPLISSLVCATFW